MYRCIWLQNLAVKTPVPGLVVIDRYCSAYQFALAISYCAASQTYLPFAIFSLLWWAVSDGLAAIPGLCRIRGKKKGLAFARPFTLNLYFNRPLALIADANIRNFLIPQVQYC